MVTAAGVHGSRRSRPRPTPTTGRSATRSPRACPSEPQSSVTHVLRDMCYLCLRKSTISSQFSAVSKSAISSQLAATRRQLSAFSFRLNIGLASSFQQSIRQVPVRAGTSSPVPSPEPRAPNSAVPNPQSPAPPRTGNSAAPAAARAAGARHDPLAVDGHGVALGIDRDLRQRVVQHHVALADACACRGRAAAARRSAGGSVPRSSDALRHERARSASGRAVRTRRTSAGSAPAPASESTRSDRPSAPPAMKPPLMTSSGLTPKNAGFHSTRSASLPTSIEPTCSAMPCAMRRVDRVLRDVAADAAGCRARARVARQRAARRLHLVRGLPRARDHLADAAHRLRVGRHHADRAEIVQHVLGRDRLRPDARFGERDVLGHLRIQVMADHQHVEVLVERVHRVRHRRIRARRQDVRLAADPDDVGRVAAAGALGVVGVDRPALERGDACPRRSPTRSACRCGSRPARRTRRRPTAQCRSPPASCPSPRAASGRSRRRRSARRAARAATRCPCRGSRSSAAAPSVASSIRWMFHAPGVQVVALVPSAGPGAAADHRRDAAGERLLRLLRADEVDVRVDAAGGQDAMLAGDDLGRRADLEARRDAVLDVRDCRPCRWRRCGRRERRRRP